MLNVAFLKNSLRLSRIRRRMIIVLWPHGCFICVCPAGGGERIHFPRGQCLMSGIDMWPNHLHILYFLGFFQVFFFTHVFTLCVESEWYSQYAAKVVNRKIRERHASSLPSIRPLPGMYSRAHTSSYFPFSDITSCLPRTCLPFFSWPHNTVPWSQRDCWTLSWPYGSYLRGMTAAAAKQKSFLRPAPKNFLQFSRRPATTLLLRHESNVVCSLLVRTLEIRMWWNFLLHTWSDYARVRIKGGRLHTL